jgi:glycosyltransferase involved in cell wall biosynthesis
MRVLYLTINPNAFGTTRIMRTWMTLGRTSGVEALAVAPGRGGLADWLSDNHFDHTIALVHGANDAGTLRTARDAWRLSRWARRRRIDLIHCNEHNCLPFAQWMQRFYRVPIVCHVRYRMNRAFTSWAFTGKKAPAALLWTTRQQREDCAEAMSGLIPDERQHLITLGVDLDTFGGLTQTRGPTRAGWGVGDGDIVIGVASVLQPRKRLHEFVDLVAQLAARDPRVVGVLAGYAYPADEPYRDDLLRYIESKHLGKHFHWLGKVDPVEPLMHGLDIFVSTSEYETFGMSVCEAMACRRPVVAYRGGAVHEVVGDAGIVLENGDTGGLLARTAELVADPILRARLGELGRRRIAEEFDPRRTFGKLKGIYADVLAQAPGR